MWFYEGMEGVKRATQKSQETFHHRTEGDMEAEVKIKGKICWPKFSQRH